MKLCVYYFVRRWPDSCLHGLLFSMPYVYESRQIYPHGVVTIKLVSVIPTRLYILIMKLLVTAKAYCFDQISAYQKPVVFL